MKSLSKVFKSSYIQMGTPKPLESIVKPVALLEPDDTGQENTVHQESPEEIAKNIIEDAKQMYLKIIEEANQEAKKIIENADEDAERLLISTKEKAYKEGFEAGYSDSRKEARKIIDEAAEIRTFLDERKAFIYKEAEEDVVSLVLDISRKVIGEEVQQNKDTVFSLIRQALDKCAFKNKLMLRVSQSDYAYVSENKKKISRLVEGISDIEVAEDLSLKEGGCIIETPSGEINSSIEIQMNELERIFLYMLRNE